MPDAVGEERMEVRVEPQAVPEALHHANRRAVTIGDTVLAAGTVAIEVGNGAGPHGEDFGEEPVVVGDPIAQPEGQRQHPLPHRHGGDDVIDQMRGLLRHPSAVAAGAQAADLAGEGDEQLGAAAGATQPGEP